jgi:nickel/cobalt exporter
MAPLQRILLALFIAVAAALTVTGTAWAADLFGKPDQPAAGNTEQAAPAPAPNPSMVLPAPLRPILGAIVRWQTNMNRAMRNQLLAAREGRSLRPALIIVLFAFLYGVGHAVGPGHGKVVIGSYFLTRRAAIIQGVAMSGVAALVQAISAIVLVGALALILDASSAAILDQAATIEVVSYGAIVAIGLWMAYGVLSGRTHDHGHGHDHNHDHGHDHDPGHAHKKKAARSEWTRLLATGAAVGLRPCSGAILVLLFSLANDIVAIGVLATFAMAAGVAITVTAVTLGSLGIRHASAAIGGRTVRMAETGYKAVALSGALVIALFGLLELIGVWTGVLTPGAG